MFTSVFDCIVIVSVVHKQTQHSPMQPKRFVAKVRPKHMTCSFSHQCTLLAAAGVILDVYRVPVTTASAVTYASATERNVAV